jgi:hypothetical protein
LGKDAGSGSVGPYQGANHDQGNKIGHIGNGLDRALEGDVFYLIEQKRQEYRRGKTEDNAEEAYGDGVPEYPEKIYVLEKGREMLQTHKGAPGKPEIGPVILKRDDKAVHGFVGKEGKIDKYREYHKVLVFVLGKILCSGFAPHIFMVHRGSLKTLLPEGRRA